jgi:hypothetical protein
VFFAGKPASLHFELFLLAQRPRSEDRDEVLMSLTRQAEAHRARGLDV